MVNAAERIDRILQRTNGKPSEYNDKEKIVENLDAILDDVFSIAWAMGLRIKRDHIIEACGLSAGNENVRIIGPITKNRGGRPKNTTIEGVKSRTKCGPLADT